MFRSATTGDAPAICDIYNPFVAGTIVTFEEEEVVAAEMARRIAEVTARLPWLVAERQGAVVGYAYAVPWRTRPAYRFAAEATVYLAPDAQGQGLGAEIYRALIAELRTRRLHTAIGGIALPNAASVALHERLGFHKVAHFEQVGWKLGRWVDVGFWQLAL